LGVLTSKKSVEPLCLALRDEEWSVRYHCALALGEIGDTAAVIPLIKTLNDRHENVRRGVVQALGQMGDKRAVPALERQRKHDENLVTSLIDVVLPGLRKGRKVAPKPEYRLLPQPIITNVTIKPKAAILAARNSAAAAMQSSMSKDAEANRDKHK
jgi:HEAT repeat protein